MDICKQKKPVVIPGTVQAAVSMATDRNYKCNFTVKHIYG